MNKRFIFGILFALLLVLSAIKVEAAFVRTIYTANGTYTAPSDVTAVFVEAWGGGGGGGAGQGSGSGGGNGGGGSGYARSIINVTPGTTYNVTVGTGGAGGASQADGKNGTPSWFINQTTFYADYGKGGGHLTAQPGGPGGNNNTANLARFNGGVGGDAGAGTTGGGGGGSAGELEAGSAGGVPTAGVGGRNLGAAGGIGGVTSAAGATGGTYGGGGGGSGTGAGGNGGPGVVIILGINSSWNDYTVSVFDEVNLTAITQTVNATMSPTSNASGDITVNTTLSKIYVPPVPSWDAINLKLSSNLYAQRGNLLQGSTNTTLNQTLYLAQGTSSTYFSVQDQTTSQVITQAIMTMSRDQGNGTIITVQSGYTDVTGSIVLQYIPNIRYMFLLTNPAYNTKSFVLDPVLASTYTVRMLALSGTSNYSPDYQNVLVDYSPKQFYANQTNTFTIIFDSITNSFTNYSYNLSYPGGSKAGSSTTAGGTTFITTFNITGGNILSTANLTITYTTSLGTKRFNFTHGIIYGPNNGTVAAMAQNQYDLGLLERVIIGTGIILIFAGGITLAAGPVAGLTVALLIMGFFVKIGFWEWWLAGISFLIGLVMIIRRSD